MLRYVIIIAIVCIVVRWALGKWPWQYLNPAPTRSQALFRARKLLGVQHGATREEIKAAHKRLMTFVHPDRGGSGAAVHEANDARDLLLSELPDNGARGIASTETDTDTSPDP